jgi:hypothetical protein
MRTSRIVHIQRLEEFMPRNGMVAFAILERLRDELLEYRLEICQAADDPELVLIHERHATKRHSIATLRAADKNKCAPILDGGMTVELLLRAYKTTHDERKETIVWILARAAQAYAKMHNERLLTLSTRRIDFLTKYVEETASELGVSMSQPLHAALACYLIESNSWLS